MSENEFSPAFSPAFDALLDASTCSWPVSYVDCSGECSAYEAWPEDQRAQAKALFEAWAVDWLGNWTNGLFGVCSTVVRPCRDDCAGAPSPSSTYWGRGPRYDPGFPRHGVSTGGSSWVPVLIGGRWFNMTCGCLGTCSCALDGPTVLALPGPIQAVERVTIDGIALDPSTYYVRNARYLIRTDGGVWPACQDMLAPDDAPGTFVVTYDKGVPVPIGGQAAAGRLACELARAACNDDDCALPERLQTVTRQGITVGVFASEEAWKQTGIWSIDNWVSSVTQPKPFASVRSVDIPVR